MVLAPLYSDTSLDGFRQWLTKEVDRNHDGRISMLELRSALKRKGYNRATWKGILGVICNDLNHNGFIDTEAEILALANYAVRTWGFTIA
ncbi:EF-hand-containing protein [Dioscorea alata]|uniref:EF-hand-containing protein n=1 Tax=Dioscorea alata TaxID=55571 RepID=A0ACB7TXQ6_DIOAL|nr:EF-hand-containing protein [Dioscorea alata]